MDRSISKKLDMAVRVQEWQRAHPPTDRNQVGVVQRFEALLAKAQALFLDEHAQRQAARLVSRGREEVRRGIERQMRSVTRIGAFATRGDARATASFVPLDVKVGNSQFLAAASTLLDTVRQHQEVLLSHGVTKAQVNSAAAGLERFRQAVSEEQASRQQHAATRAALQGAVGELFELVRLLDAFNRDRFDGDARMLGLWRSVSVVNRAAATRARRAPPVDDAAESPPPAASPTAPPVVSPAAPHSAPAPSAETPDTRKDHAA